MSPARWVYSGRMAQRPLSRPHAADTPMGEKRESDLKPDSVRASPEASPLVSSCNRWPSQVTHTISQRGLEKGRMEEYGCHPTPPNPTNTNQPQGMLNDDAAAATNWTDWKLCIGVINLYIISKIKYVTSIGYRHNLFFSKSSISLCLLQLKSLILKI